VQDDESRCRCSDRSHENAALLKLFLIAPPPEKARDLFRSRERGLRAD
jgi:hypothetical protein